MRSSPSSPSKTSDKPADAARKPPRKKISAKMKSAESQAASETPDRPNRPDRSKTGNKNRSTTARTKRSPKPSAAEERKFSQEPSALDSAQVSNTTEAAKLTKKRTSFLPEVGQAKPLAGAARLRQQAMGQSRDHSSPISKTSETSKQEDPSPASAPESPKASITDSADRSISCKETASQDSTHTKLPPGPAPQGKTASPPPVRQHQTKINPRLLCALSAGIIFLTGIIILPSFIWKQAPPDLEPVEVPRSSGLLWDAQKAQSELSLPAAPPLPPKLGSETQDREARTRRITNEEGREAALADAEREALLSPDSAYIQHHAAMLALGLGQRDKARLYFEASLRADPYAPGSLFNLAEMNFRNRDFQKAADLYTTLATVQPGNSWVYFRLFLCHLILGESDPLNEEQLPMGSLAGLYARAILAVRQGDTRRAMEFVLTARQRFPGQTAPYDTQLMNFNRQFPLPAQAPPPTTISSQIDALPDSQSNGH